MVAIAGIDYSMTCPCICIHENETDSEFSIDNCKFFYLTTHKKFAGEFLAKKITGHYMALDQFECDEDRYNELSDYFMDCLEGFDCKEVAIENYAYAAKGQVFNIGENTGLLKYKLWMHGEYATHKFAPAQVKKFATGKGNATKDMMIAAFHVETGIDLFYQLRLKSNKAVSPITDMVDAYYITKCLFYSGVPPEKKTINNT